MNEKSQTNKVGEMYHRPWGTYQTLYLGDNSQVKLITVIPSGRLSLQKHQHRAEHWIVIKGQLTVTVGTEVRQLKVNDTVMIAKEVTHRAENFTEEVAMFVEVQIGEYFGEDDIIRIEDIYGRK